MGYVRHQAIVVTSWDADLLKRAHLKAVDLGLRVTNVIPSEVNQYQSFMVGPDGSKSGWDVDGEGDLKRHAWRCWANEQRHEDGSSSLYWVEIDYGGDEAEKVSINDWSGKGGGAGS